MSHSVTGETQFHLALPALEEACDELGYDCFTGERLRDLIESSGSRPYLRGRQFFSNASEEILAMVKPDNFIGRFLEVYDGRSVYDGDNPESRLTPLKKVFADKLTKIVARGRGESVRESKIVAEVDGKKRSFTKYELISAGRGETSSGGRGRG